MQKSAIFLALFVKWIARNTLVIAFSIRHLSSYPLKNGKQSFHSRDAYHPNYGASVIQGPQSLHSDSVLCKNLLIFIMHKYIQAHPDLSVSMVRPPYREPQSQLYESVMCLLQTWTRIFDNLYIVVLVKIIPELWRLFQT